MQNIVNERFVKAVNLIKENKSLTYTELAKSINYKPQAFSEIINGRTKVNLNVLQNFCKKYSVSSEWILFGIGEIFSQNNTKPEEKKLNKELNLSLNESLNSLQQSTNLSPKVLKTYINLDSEKALQVLEDEGLVGRRVYISPEPAIAGYLGSYVSEGKESLEWFYMPFLRENGLYACFRVQGRSMEEYVLEGSWVVCRLLEQSWQIRSGNIHLVATKSEGVLLKRLRIEPKLKDKGIICYSDNPHYLPFFVPNEEVLAVWAVEMFIQREFPFLNEKAAKNLDNYLDSLEL